MQADIVIPPQISLAWNSYTLRVVHFDWLHWLWTLTPTTIDTEYFWSLQARLSSIRLQYILSWVMVSRVTEKWLWQLIHIKKNAHSEQNFSSIAQNICIVNQIQWIEDEIYHQLIPWLQVASNKEIVVVSAMSRRALSEARCGLAFILLSPHFEDRYLHIGTKFR